MGLFITGASVALISAFIGAMIALAGVNLKKD